MAIQSTKPRFRVGDHVSFTDRGQQLHGNIQLRLRTEGAPTEANRMPARDSGGQYMVLVAGRGNIFAHEAELSFAAACVCSIKPIARRSSHYRMTANNKEI